MRFFALPYYDRIDENLSSSLPVAKVALEMDQTKFYGYLIPQANL